MKLVSSIISVIGLSLLAGCTIGNGHICGPQTPLAYCDRDAYERLVHPRGLGEYWEKHFKTHIKRSKVIYGRA